jgi:putative PEP-CTERM system histidine kinase
VAGLAITSETILWTSAALAFFVAVVVLVRERISIPTLAFAAGLLLFAADSALGALSSSALTLGESWRLHRWRFLPLALSPAVWLTFAVSYAQTNHKAVLKRWALGIACLLIIPTVALLFQEELFIPVLTGYRLSAAGRVIHVLLVLGATAVLMNVERTFRASVGVIRWQFKFTAIGLAALFLTRIYTSTQWLIYSSIDPSLDTFNALALALCAILILLSLARAKRSVFDIYPSPILVYRSFAVLLVGAYLLVIGLLANASAFWGIRKAFPFQAFVLLVALVLLGIVLVSDRARLQMKRFVGRHLRRPVHDVRKIWRTFSEALAGQVEEKQLCRATVKWVSETFDALSVSIWLQRGGSLALGGSTTSIENTSIASSEDLSETLQKLRRHGGPIDIDASHDQWMEPLRQCHARKFPHGGNRICVPILGVDELSALMVLGDRVAGVPFSVEEFDLFKCIGDQIAGDLSRIRLSQRLVEAKEMQAFQTMAAFFVHDLKNTAWTLSLLLDNLQKHFERPEFREEAVRAVGKSVGRINDLIGRIGSLRHELRMNQAPVDLNGVIQEVIKEFPPTTDVKVITNLSPLPMLPLDREQMHKVFVNLLVNAREASHAGGTIRCETSRRGSDAVVTVQDDGSGMTAEFLHEHLFKPFRTTKKKGIGIGMFQSKMIVEAHEGRIEVQSKEGQGTTFTIVLPINEATN